VCTYQTEHIGASGSGKGAEGWFSLTDASVYLDHPYHAPYEHALTIDFLNPAKGPGARVAVELEPAMARELAAAIVRALDSAPPGLIAGSRSQSGNGGPS
jgi:hypothetical protein